VYYIQFIQPKPGVDEAELARVLEVAKTEWEELYPEDVQVLSLRRVWRLGEYEYIKIWKVRDLARLDEWSRLVEDVSEAGDHVSEWLKVVDDKAGVYNDA
jgi:hypothetical protein